MAAYWLRIRALIRRRRLERDLDEELAFHLAMRTADYAAGGGISALSVLLELVLSCAPAKNTLRVRALARWGHGLQALWPQ